MTKVRGLAGGLAKGHASGVRRMSKWCVGALMAGSALVSQPSMAVEPGAVLEDAPAVSHIAPGM